MTTITQFETRLMQLVTEVERPDTNAPEQQQQAFDLAIGNAMQRVADRFAKKPKEAYRKEALARQGDNPVYPDVYELYADSAITIAATINSPRTSFDLDEFIRLIAADTSYSIAELHNLAQTTRKMGSPVVSVAANPTR